ncbi:MAG: hypothetical protein Q9227_005856 [Pyrenula ochraceoflavens]
MSRPVAGVRNRTLILTLPGSPKGAKENLQAVIKLLPHACTQATGADSRTLHAGGLKKLEMEAGISVSNTSSSQNVSGGHTHSHGHNHHQHHHGHGHSIPKPHSTAEERARYQSNDPSAGPTQRHRRSPYRMISVSEALKLIEEQTPAPECVDLPHSSSLVGFTVARDIFALEAVPAFPASIVDGYALHTDMLKQCEKDSRPTLPVAAVSHAEASSNPPPLPLNSVARITTGAPLPPNTNTVIMVEDTVIASTTKRDAQGLAHTEEEESSITLLTTSLKPDENVRAPGSDIALNSLILRAGTMISPNGGEVGLLAAGGISTVPVYRLPRVGVLSTGDEVLDISHGGPLGSGGSIRDSNRPALLSAISSWSITSAVVDLGIARDTPSSALEESLRDALMLKGLDVIVTTGGVSMGELDLLKPTIERVLGGTVHFGRVRMKPGKPTTFATLETKSSSGERKKKLLFALPGNPASALVTAHLFVLPSLAKMAGRVPSGSGAGDRGLQKVKVKIDMPNGIKCDPARTEYHRVVVRCGSDGYLWARSTGMQRSSRVGSLASANALLVLPEKEGVLAQGEWCEALMMGMLEGLED